MANLLTSIFRLPNEDREALTDKEAARAILVQDYLKDESRRGTCGGTSMLQAKTLEFGKDK
jgi:hypothetical protein